MDTVMPDNLKKLMTNYLILNDDVNFEDFKNSSKQIVNFDNTNQVYSPELIKLILSNETYFKNLIELFNNAEITTIKPGKIINGDILSTYPLTKSLFVKLSENMFLNGELNHIENIEEKLSILQNLTSVENLKQNNKLYTKYADGKKLSLPVSTLTELYETGFKFDNPEQFEKSTINNLNNAELSFLLKAFAQDYNIFSLYCFPNESINFYTQLLKDTYANTVHFNKLNKTKDPFLQYVSLNDELINYVFKNMPENFYQVEKAIYVYIKLCQVLTYDPEFYASNQKGYSAELHEDIFRLCDITPSNPEIVCYEFNQIYGKFLNMLGINYSTNTVFDDVYGKGHATLTFKANKFIVNADSLRSIFNGDLFNAKLNYNINGLQCENLNEKALKVFNTSLKKVYNHIKQNEPSKYVESNSFKSWLEVYNKLSKISPFIISPTEKFDMLKAQLQQSSAPIMEKFAYLLNYSKFLFDNERKTNRFQITMIKELIKTDVYKYMPLAIMIYHPEIINENPNENIYVLYNHKGEFSKVSYEDLTERFNTNKYGYIKENSLIIPGIKPKGAKHD